VTLGRAGVAGLPEVPRNARVEAVLSAHHVHYALLPWTDKLEREDEWTALAHHHLVRAHGRAAENWEVRVSPAPTGKPRVACGIERALRVELRAAIAHAGARLVSVQPMLMRAFNAHRAEFRRSDGWLVCENEGRLTLGLIENGAWALVRVRNVDATWREGLRALLRREADLAKHPATVERVVFA
jgi:hypothetical protein